MSHGEDEFDPPSRSGYHRMDFAEKERYAKRDEPPRKRYRCVRCKVVVEDRDRGGHVDRCWPEVFMERFMRVD